MKIDITLRELLQSIPEKFIKILTGKRGIRLYDTSLPEVKERRVDLLVELEDGKLFHLEVQTGNDKNMAYRMLEYFTLLKKQYEEKEIVQMVLYVGEEKLRMEDKIELNNLKYSYILKDIREIDCEELLASDNIEDKILSLLCEVKDEERYVRNLIREILMEEEERRKDIILKVLTLSRLRKRLNERIGKLLEEGDMPITIDLEKDPYYLRGIEKGKIEGRIEGIKEGIEKGIEEGIREAIIKIHRQLSLSAEEIAKIMEMPEEKIKEILDKSD